MCRTANFVIRLPRVGARGSALLRAGPICNLPDLIGRWLSSR